MSVCRKVLEQIKLNTTFIFIVYFIAYPSVNMRTHYSQSTRKHARTNLYTLRLHDTVGCGARAHELLHLWAERQSRGVRRCYSVPDTSTMSPVVLGETSAGLFCNVSPGTLSWSERELNQSILFVYIDSSIQVQFTWANTVKGSQNRTAGTGTNGHYTTGLCIPIQMSPGVISTKHIMFTSKWNSGQMRPNSRV